MEEVVFADDVYIMDKGNIVMHGTPREVFSQVEKLKSYHLDVPQITDLAHELKKRGVGIPDGILTIDELEKALEGTTGTGVVVPDETAVVVPDETAAAAGGTTGTGVVAPAAPLIELKDVCYTYGDGTVYEVKALDHVSLKIYPGEFIGLIGHTGSGKSTLVQHLNGLIEPTSGQVLFEGKDIRSDGFDLRHLRTQVGLVFQYPEHQLFETDVLKDVCFGPKNEGLSQEEAVKRATHALRHVGVPEEMYKESPFEISGGQKRRVAIAGVLAMDPKVLILDEPTAGLDPQGRDEILDRIKYLQVKRGITIVLVTHSMEDAAMYADRLVVMNDAKVAFDDKPRRVFSHFRELEKMGLAAPQITYLMNDLKEHGFDVDTEAMTVAEATETILKALKNKTEQKPEDGSLNSGDK